MSTSKADELFDEVVSRRPAGEEAAFRERVRQLNGRKLENKSVKASEAFAQADWKAIHEHAATALHAGREAVGLSVHVDPYGKGNE